MSDGKVTTINIDTFWKQGFPLGPPPPEVIREVGRAAREKLTVHLASDRMSKDRVDALKRRQQVISWTILYLGQFLGKVKITFGTKET